MTLASKDMELIKQEVAGIRDFYQSRMDSDTREWICWTWPTSAVC